MSRLDVFKRAVQLSVEGDPVALQSIKGPDGEEFHVTPRKFSKKHAAKIRKLLMASAEGVSPSVAAKIVRLRKEYGDDITEEILTEALTPEELAALTAHSDPDLQYQVEQAKILYGIAEHDLSDPAGPMTQEIVDLILESRDVAKEVLEAVDALNPPFGQETSPS